MIEKMHTFHIPVMGIGFTIDTALKVSQYGIDSVISLVDDMLLEKMRAFYSKKYKINYQEITEKIDDYRAKRITSYLNLINSLAKRKFNILMDTAKTKGSELKKYIEMLPENSTLKLKNTSSILEDFSKIEKWTKDNFRMGSIDVNVMTKLDKENYFKGKKKETEYNDGHAAIRGYAMSELSSSIILSAGMNPKLYSYLENFDDFYPDENGKIKKKITLKVSDYRSALIQGKFLAKKGLWVSEYRIESGLNCGGHAFATDGYLLGPILASFKDKKDQLTETIYSLLLKSLKNKKRSIPIKNLSIKITAQGGVGSAEEHRFLMEHYKLDSIGWGSPFLLVPEATTVDNLSLKKLTDAKEEDLYLSDISPLGVPFNNLKNNTKDIEKKLRIENGRPGSPCIKKYAASNKEFTEANICVASRQYQQLKLKELEKGDLLANEYDKAYKKIVEKSCICVGLGTTALLNYDLDTKPEGDGVSICPGPNLAYFSKVMSLKEITDHIYGRKNVVERTDRPNLFIKELSIYIKYLNDKIKEEGTNLTDTKKKYLLTFIKNLEEGIEYYLDLFKKLKDFFTDQKESIFLELMKSKKSLYTLSLKVNNLLIT